VLDSETALAIASWSPRRHTAVESEFCRRVVSGVAPISPQRAKALLFASGKLATYAISIGLELEEHLVFHDSVIERFCSSRLAGTPVTARTLRANLRFVARHCVKDPRPQPVRMPRDHAKVGYSALEITRYLELADAQPTALRRMRSSALISLGAGAGLIGGELRHVRGTDIVCRSGGVLVTVSTRHPRSVPVLAPYQSRLTEARDAFGDRYLVTGKNPESHNVTNPIIRSLSGGIDLPRLETARLRSTYLTKMAETIGLRAFMDAAGVSCSQRLGDLVAHLQSPDEETAVRLLAGVT